MRCLEPTNACASSLSSSLALSFSVVRRPTLCTLAVAARAGDERAAQQLATRLFAVLRALVGRRAPWLASWDVEDLLQDVVAGAMSIDVVKFDASKGRFFSFVAKRLRWRLADQLRTTQRNRMDALEEMPPEEEPVDLQELARADDTAKERALQALPVLVDASLSSLRDAQARRALQLHDGQGLTLVDTAKALGVHPSNACRARKRALKHLARTLPPEVRAAA